MDTLSGKDVIAAFAVLVTIGTAYFLLAPRPRQYFPRTACFSNVKQLAFASVMYADDNDDRLPLAEWETALLAYAKHGELFRCPFPKEARREDRKAYAMNAHLLGRRLDRDPALALVFDSDQSGPDALSVHLRPVAGDRHQDVLTVGYADGHVKPSQIPALAGIRMQPTSVKP